MLFSTITLSTITWGCKKDDDDDNKTEQNTNNQNKYDNENNGQNTNNSNDANTWDLIYEISNQRDETIYFYINDKAKSVIPTGQKVSGVISLNTSSANVYIRTGESDRIIERETVRNGTSYITTIYNDCYYNNTNTLKISNTSGDTYAIYINNEFIMNLSSGKYIEKTMTAGQTYQLYALQKDGYIFYPTEKNATHSGESCTLKTWSIK